MMRKRGFTLVELVISIFIIGIVALIGVNSWQGYVRNQNLRTAAREIVSDFNFMKVSAASNTNFVHWIFFNRTANNYTLNANTIAGGGGADAPGFPKTKTLSSFGSDVIFFSLPSGGATSNINFTARGTLNPTTGTIVLRNGLATPSEATIIYRITGKTNVSFAMH